MQRIKDLLTGEDRGVSPVIGVILMVAITVILAAVIATFVIGLGDSTDDVSPTISFEDSYENQSTNADTEILATISIDTSDQGVEASNIEVLVDGTQVGDWSDGGGEISAGESITIANADDEGNADYSASDVDINSDSLEGGETITIRFSTEDSSDKLTEFEVPEDL